MFDLNFFQLLAEGQDPADAMQTKQVVTVAIVIAVLVLPFWLGSVFAKLFRMPTHGTRIGVVLFAIISAAVILFSGTLKYGVDLRGGTILVYEVLQDETTSSDPGARVTAKELVGALGERINPSGTKEIVIRPYGDRQIEIIVPDVEEHEVNRIKRVVSTAGSLRFAIVANERDHLSLIERVRSAGVDKRDVVKDESGNVIGVWAKVDREESEVLGGIKPLRVYVASDVIRDSRSGRILQPRIGGEEYAFEKWLQQNSVADVDVLMSIEKDFDITGEDLDAASVDHDGQGNPAVHFVLNSGGQKRFYVLTLNNSPDGAFSRRLGIVLDNKLLSAPSIRSPINGSGQITGNFSRAEVEFLVGILRAGKLPAALSKQPISENQIGSTLGDDTIRKGVYSISASLILVLVFILFYYRFAGVVACLALVLNLALIVAVMMVISQPATLPGLAGLVLTVGMSVDANVLIFERIREELRRGAAPRMAIRNGFGRATTTIVDANLTTLITAIVLYLIGTDQVRGFAVALILGILFSMFTAIYVSRTLFDIAERWGWVSLGMSDLVSSIRDMVTGKAEFDFIGKRGIAFVFSMVLISSGIAALALRGNSIFDIDFAGGTSVTFWVQEDADADEIRKIVGESLNDTPESNIQFSLNRVEMDGMTDRVFAIYTSVEEVAMLKEKIKKGFETAGNKGLVTYQAEIETGGAPEPETTGALLGGNLIRTVAYRPQDAPDGDVAVEDAEAPAESEAPAEPEVAAENPVSTATVRLGVAGSDRPAKITGAALIEGVLNAAAAKDIAVQEEGIIVTPIPKTPKETLAATEWTKDSNMGFSEWSVQMDLSAEESSAITSGLKSELDSDPVWLSASKVGKRVAGDMTNRAIAALLASLVFIVGYIWFRFQRVAFGFAAVVALIHDVLVTLGAIAASYWLASYLGFLLIDEFRISLAVVASLLTIIGYSLNDTIVVFDRIREVRGKSPKLTAEMINTSINQTLSRTLLTSVTTLIVVVLLYVFGGEGIHSFAFALTVGVIVGTYSSIFVASPTLLWLFNRGEDAAAAGR